MRLFSLEHSATEYGADVALYGALVVLLAILLVEGAPGRRWPEVTLFVTWGLLGWSLVEYLVHRFVLHGVQPFRRWHARHHQRPTALIYAPTLLTATLIVTLVFLPALLLGQLWRACALTLGVSTGYLAYTLTHHAVHRGRPRSAWLKQRQIWHALHHCPSDHHRGRYGVTTALWDSIFRTGGGGRAGKH